MNIVNKNDILSFLANVGIIKPTAVSALPPVCEIQDFDLETLIGWSDVDPKSAGRGITIMGKISPDRGTVVGKLFSSKNPDIIIGSYKVSYDDCTQLDYCLSNLNTNIGIQIGKEIFFFSPGTNETSVKKVSGRQDFFWFI